MLGALSPVWFSACGTAATRKQVDAEIAQEPTAVYPGEIADRNIGTIDLAEHLTAEQKSKLKAIQARGLAEGRAIRAEQQKLHSLIVKAMVREDYDEREVSILVKRLKGLDDRRVTLMMGAVEEAKAVLGKATLQDANILRGMFNEKTAGRL
jgi:Spy/CpxP family protein refolding chaperone